MINKAICCQCVLWLKSKIAKISTLKVKRIAKSLKFDPVNNSSLKVYKSDKRFTYLTWDLYIHHIHCEIYIAIHSGIYISTAVFMICSAVFIISTAVFIICTTVFNIYTSRA